MPAGRHVLIDGYFLGKPYGFGRHIFELCRALGRLPSDIRITVAVPDNVPSSLIPNCFALNWKRLPQANFMVWEQIFVPRLARHLGCDVIHFPYNTRALSMRGARSVTTVHDLLFLTGSACVSDLKAFVAEKYTSFAFRNATVKSNALISVSNTTRAALAAIGHDSVVVYNTVDGFIERAKVTARPGQKQKFLLHRGGYQPHRNTKRVIAAFRQAQREVPDIELKIIGAPDGAARCDIADTKGINFLPRVSDSELAALYSTAAAVIATSLKEGFGLPIIEGFAFDTPVITSDIDPMREIAGDAAILVDPYNTGEIANAMMTLLTKQDCTDALVAKGRLRLQDFASTRIAEQMLSIYSRM